MREVKIKLIKRLKEIGVIYREPVKLRSGTVSDFYCDVKKAYGYPDILNCLVDEIGKNLPKSITCIAASGYGGLPIAAAVSIKFNKKFIAVRDAVKKHGKGGIIDGYVPTNKDSVVIIDDVLTTGNSIKTTLVGLKTTKAKINSAIVVVKRGEAKLPIPYSYIFTINEIIKI